MTAFPIDVETIAHGEYRLSWNPSFSAGSVAVHAHTCPEQVVDVAPLLQTDQSFIHIRGLAPQRHYFYLKPGVGAGLTAAERALPLEGGTNFRDMGGYLTEQGTRVRWGRLYRSGHTATLTEQDQQLVAGLDIRVCCDFRRPEERQIETIRLPRTTRIVGLTIDPGSNSFFFDKIAEGEGAPEDMVDFMREINRAFAREHAGQYARMFEELLQLDSGAFMINCAAGKDRTGFGAAMILAALGVPRQTILDDYMLSARYYPIEREMARVIGKFGAEAGRNLNATLVRPMMEARLDYLQAALDTIAEDYLSVDGYLAEELGVGEIERRELRARLTSD